MTDRVANNVNAAFNPYHEWLGLGIEVAAPNHFELLGLEPGETERSRIQAAADRASARVRGFRPGPRAAAWAQLLDEIARAKTCLIDPATRSAYEAQLRGPSGSSGAPADPHGHGGKPEVALVNRSPDLYPPGMGPSTQSPRPKPAPTGLTPAPAGRSGAGATGPDSSVGPDGNTAQAHAEAISRTLPRPAALPARPPGDVVDGDDVGHSGEVSGGVRVPVAPGPINAHVAPPRENPASLVPVVAAIAVVLVVLTFLVLLLAMRGDAGTPSSAAAGDSASPRSKLSQPSVVPRADFGVATPNTSSRSATDSPRREPRSSDRRVPPATVLPPSETDLNAMRETPPDRPREAESSDTAPPADAVASRPPDWNASAEPVAAGAGDARSWKRTLDQARTALALQQFDTARRQLEAARGQAMGPAQLAEVARWELLADYAREFWLAVDRGVRQFRGAEELEIGSGDFLVAVVETGPGWITIRHQGRNTRYTVDGSMPPGLALAIARTTLDSQEPEHLIMMGAGLATTREPKPLYLQEARRYWSRALAQGADVAELLTLLDADQPHTSP